MINATIPWRAFGVTLLVAALLIGYNFWLGRNTDGLGKVPAPPQPGYYLKDARILETQADGAGRLKLHAATITQNPTDDSIALEQVTVNYRSDDETEWLLSAITGALPADASNVELHGAVHLQPAHSNQHTGGNLELNTDSLHLDLLNNLARTSDVIRLTMNGQQLTARGLQADLKRQTLKLESQVHGVFLPQ